MHDGDAELDEERMNCILKVLEFKTQVFVTSNKSAFTKKTF